MPFGYKNRDRGGSIGQIQIGRLCDVSWDISYLQNEEKDIALEELLDL